jgi:hypothetical protein
VTDSKVTPVVFDVPDISAPIDATAIDTIKRKLGINSFRGTIFDGAEPPGRQLIQQDIPAKLLTLDRVLDCADRCDDSCACPNTGCSVDKTISTRVESVATDDDCPGAASTVSGAAVETQSRPVALVKDKSGDRGAIDVLRYSSTQMDEVARHLEDDDRYDEADAMREAAQQLRVLARGFKHATAPTASGEAPRGAATHRPVGYGRAVVGHGYGWEVHDE